MPRSRDTLDHVERERSHARSQPWPPSASVPSGFWPRPRARLPLRVKMRSCLPWTMFGSSNDVTKHGTQDSITCVQPEKLKPLFLGSSYWRQQSLELDTRHCSRLSNRWLWAKRRPPPKGFGHTENLLCAPLTIANAFPSSPLCHLIAPYGIRSSLNIS